MVLCFWLLIDMLDVRTDRKPLVIPINKEINKREDEDLGKYVGFDTTQSKHKNTGDVS